MTGAVSFLAPLTYCSRASAGTSDQLGKCQWGAPRQNLGDVQLLNVDCRGPLVVAEKVEAPHADLSKVTRMVYSDRSAGVVDQE